MADNTNITLKLRADIKDLQKGFRQATAVIKQSNAEFQTVANSLDDWGNSADGVRAKMNNLTTVLQQERKQLKILEEQERKAIQLYGADSVAVQNLRLRIEKLKGTINANVKAFGNYESKLDSIVNPTKSVEEATEDLHNAMSDLESKTHVLGEGFTTLKGIIVNLATDAIRQMVDGLKDAAKYALECGTNFESGMSEVAAISGATTDELEAMTTAAKEVGSEGIYGASRTAEALKYMALAGWDAESSVSALPDVLNLATASGMDLGEASDIVTDYLTAFGKSAEDSTAFVDALTYAQANSNTTVSMLGEAFQNVAATSTQLGYSFEDTTGALMVLANSGIKGGAAGTALASIMTRLGNNTSKCRDKLEGYGVEVYDAEGNVKSLSSILNGMKGTWADLTDEEKANLSFVVAGKTAQSELMTLLSDTTNQIDDYSYALANCDGNAQQMSDTMTDNLSSSVEKLKAKAEDLGIAFYDNFSDTAKGAVEDLTDYLSKSSIKEKVEEIGKKVGEALSELIENLPDIIQKIKEMLPTITEVAKVVATMFVTNKIVGFVTSIGNVANTFVTLASKTSIATAAMELFNASNPMGWAVIGATAVAGIATAIVDYTTGLDRSTVIQAEFNEEQQKLIDRMDATTESYKNYQSAKEQIAETYDDETENAEILWGELQNITEENGKIKDGYEKRAEIISGQLSESLGIEIETVDGVIQKYDELKQSVDEVIASKKADAIISAYSDEYATAIKTASEAQIEFDNAIQQRNMNMDAFDVMTRAAEDLKNQLYDGTEDLERLKSTLGETGYDTTWLQQLIDDGATMADVYNELTQNQIPQAQAKYTEFGTAANNAANQVETSTNDISNYETLMADASEQNFDKLDTDISNFLTGAETKEGAALDNSLVRQDAYWGDVTAKVADGKTKITSLLSELASEGTIKGNEFISNLQAALSAGAPEVEGTMATLVSQAKSVAAAGTTNNTSITINNNGTASTAKQTTQSAKKFKGFASLVKNK